VILSVEPIVVEQRPSSRMTKRHVKASDDNSVSSTHRVRTVTKLAECVIAREKDFGVKDIQFTTITHLGPILQPGDTVLGYDLNNTNLNVNEELMDSFNKVSKNLPDVVLVRKVREICVFFSSF
jgi:NMD protein affecting ribosome stability and mRNA decay